MIQRIRGNNGSMITKVITSALVRIRECSPVNIMR